jgi:H+/Cl- antiporter ClcA
LSSANSSVSFTICLFLGLFSFRYDANAFTPASPWGPFVILGPVCAVIAVTFLVSTFAPEARGHGVPEVAVGVLIYGLQQRFGHYYVVLCSRWPKSRASTSGA